MSHRLQVLIPEDLNTAIRKAAERESCSKGEWVRRAIEQRLARQAPENDPLATLLSLEAPTADIGGMLDEIELGRR